MSVFEILKELITEFDCKKKSICDLQKEFNKLSSQPTPSKDEQRKQMWIQIREKHIEIETMIKQLEVIMKKINRTILNIPKETNELFEQILLLEEGEERNQKIMQFREKNNEIHMVGKQLQTFIENLYSSIYQ